MHRQRLLIGLMAASLAGAACSSSAPSQTPEPTQAHPEWQLVGQKANGIWPTLQVTPVSDTVISVVLAVSGGCPDGGPATPSFAGFTVKGETLEAVVSRKPIPTDQCLVHGGIEFDVLLDLQALPASVRTVALGGGACQAVDEICPGLSVPLPVKGLASPSG